MPAGDLDLLPSPVALRHNTLLSSSLVQTLPFGLTLALPRQPPGWEGTSRLARAGRARLVWASGLGSHSLGLACDLHTDPGSVVCVKAINERGALRFWVTKQ